MIDGHIHYADVLGAEKLEEMISEQELDGVAVLCIPGVDDLPVEADAFAFRETSEVPVYIFGGIRRSLYSEDERDNKEAEAELAEKLVEEVKRLMEMGCDGIKLLEGKPQIRKAHPVPDFDLPVWEKFWAYVEKEQIPVVFHVNDPEEFWDVDKISKHALECGWLYDETFINNEEQYRQVFAVLERHPKLRIVFPHFFFLSKQLSRLEAILQSALNVRIDITPGIELYYNLSEQREEARKFFEKYQDRIIYGTDSGARQIVQGKGEPLSIAEAASRRKLITDFLETEGDYELKADGYYVREGRECMHGLGLPKEILNKIYYKNFLQLINRKEE